MKQMTMIITAIISHYEWCNNNIKYPNCICRSYKYIQV